MSKVGYDGSENHGLMETDGSVVTSLEPGVVALQHPLLDVHSSEHRRRWHPLTSDQALTQPLVPVDFLILFKPPPCLDLLGIKRVQLPVRNHLSLRKVIADAAISSARKWPLVPKHSPYIHLFGHNGLSLDLSLYPSVNLRQESWTVDICVFVRGSLDLE